MQKEKINLWLDDERDPVNFGKFGWKWVKTVDEAILAFVNYDVIEASLDHDLGIYSTIGMPFPKDHPRYEQTGYDLVCWMENHGVYPVNGCHVHSANPAGAARMRSGLDAIQRRKFSK